MTTTSSFLRMTEIYTPTLKEDPSDADIASARLLTRAGLMRKQASGLYTFLPLGMRVLAKIERIVREEMDAHDAQEILMPFIQPAQLWQESGRWDVYGEEMARLRDRHDNEFCLGPTHEEIVTALVRNELRSYKELPKNLYQINIKFRDERRPRFGLLRSREFIMKDAYSFDVDEAGLEKSYMRMRDAYIAIADRLGVQYRIVEADNGEIGGHGSEEFMALAQTGETELVYCECGYAADAEVGACTPHVEQHVAEGLTKIETPGVHTIDELCAFLDIAPEQTAKAFAGKDGDGGIWVLFVPGTHEVNLLKAARLLGGFEPLTDEEMIEYKLVKGSMGPVNLPDGIKVAADESLKASAQWVVGANEDGFHFVGAALDVDFKVDTFGDLCVIKQGDACPQCKKPLEGARGIEISQIFKLGDTYSKAMNATFMNEQGEEIPFVMGCYGWGVSRTIAAAVEQGHDDYGIIWPVQIAPAHVVVVPLSVGDDVVEPAAMKIVQDLLDKGYEVAYDDRDERPGVKFADNDLIGWPLHIVVGKRGLENGVVDIKNRMTGEKQSVALDEVVDLIQNIIGDVR